MATGILSAQHFVVNGARVHLRHVSRDPSTDLGTTSDRSRSCDRRARDWLSWRQYELVLDPVAQLLSVAFDEFALQRLTFRTELEGQVVEPDIAVEVAIAFDFDKAPFAVGL